MKKLGLVRIGDEPEQHFILQRGTRNNKNRTNPNTLLISIEREPNKIRIYTALSVLIVFSTQQMIQGNRILQTIEKYCRNGQWSIKMADFSSKMVEFRMLSI